MKQNIQVADEFDNIFTLASDIVGFTKMAAASEPRDVVEILSKLFCSFDVISGMGVYKVMTIGDAYIAVTDIDEKEGEPSTSGADAAARKRQAQVALTNFSLVMLNEIAKVAPPNALRAAQHADRPPRRPRRRRRDRHQEAAVRHLGHRRAHRRQDGVERHPRRGVRLGRAQVPRGPSSSRSTRTSWSMGFNKDGSKKTIDSYKLTTKQQARIDSLK